ncbi:hypothetical protein COV18_06725 [Candidatus Woesearchaeota archaeon CG10_big_fil_rev_8_21_14_0_10_37_12]|nr:MAG: hypothetical protein COV18_06725 [Candidatus Woesearchaeota archaeon CG10_big_fil_rev_8_21_14_0_10_37_12]
MVTVAHIVEKIVKQRPFLQEALTKGIINYGALADNILNEVEKELNKPVTHAAVMMALRRMNEKLETAFVKTLKFNEQCDLIIRDGLVEITVEKNKQNIEATKQLPELVDLPRGDFLTLTHGIYEITIITNQKHKKSVLNKFKKDTVTHIIDDLSALTITIPLDFLDTPGFFYLVTRELTWEDINTIEIVSTLTELTFILKSKDAPRAFTCIKQLITRK